MNERIKELAREAGFIVGVSANADRQIQSLVESIIQDCLNMCDWQTGQRIQAHFEYRDNRWPETPENPKPF